jgi:DNA-binding MarR family transcriptional regulator
MEEKGLVKRENLRDNLYRAKLVLTPEGRRAAQIVRAKAKLAVEQATVGLRDEDRAVMYACLEIIGTNLKKISEDGILSDNA